MSHPPFVISPLRQHPLSENEEPGNGAIIAVSSDRHRVDGQTRARREKHKRWRFLGPWQAHHAEEPVSSKELQKTKPGRDTVTDFEDVVPKRKKRKLDKTLKSCTPLPATDIAIMACDKFAEHTAQPTDAGKLAFEDQPDLGASPSKEIGEVDPVSDSSSMDDTDRVAPKTKKHKIEERENKFPSPLPATDTVTTVLKSQPGQEGQVNDIGNATTNAQHEPISHDPCPIDTSLNEAADSTINQNERRSLSEKLMSLGGRLTSLLSRSRRPSSRHNSP